MPDVRWHPWLVQKMHRVVATGSPGSTGIPCAMVLRFPSLSLVTGLCFHRRRNAKKNSGIIANLTPASGRQNHTTSPYASAPFVRAHRARDDATASTASRSNVRDDGQRPLSGTGRTSKATDLPKKKSGKFLAARLDRPNHPQITRKNRLFDNGRISIPEPISISGSIRTLRRGRYFLPTPPVKTSPRSAARTLPRPSRPCRDSTRADWWRHRRGGLCIENSVAASSRV